jgi:hypothetical protein
MMATPPPIATAPIAVAEADTDSAPKRHCENCGAVLLGDHCYNCGQPTKGLIRQFSAIIGDFADTVLNIDSRIIHTVGPLLFKPGYLSLEYFAGRRVRYVSPVRLLVFVAVVTFLVAQWLTPDISADGNGTTINLHSDSNGFGGATTVADVMNKRDAALAGLDAASKNIPKVPGLEAKLNVAKDEVRADADRRIAQLQGHGKPATTPPPATAAAATATDSSSKDSDNGLSFDIGGKHWDQATNPVRVTWLPASGNVLLNKGIARLQKNGLRVRQDPNLLKNAAFSTAPSTLFVLVPVFALLLKMLYLFKRRLYMEHVIVALHSHAFLCLNVLLLILTSNLRDWLAPTDGLLHALLGFIEFLLALWMPLYLLLMQKRVYGQGWPMTVIKYSTLGFLYAILLMFGMVATMIIAVIWL